MRLVSPIFAAAYAAAALIVCSPAPAPAQVVRIVAVVNDQPISELDLNARANFLLLTSNQPSTPENRRKAAPQALRQLIDEKLQIQEAEKRGIGVAEQEVAEQVAQFERANQIPPGRFIPALEKEGVPGSTFTIRLRAQLMFQKLVSRRARLGQLVTEEEVDEEIARMRAAAGQPEQLASEIFIAVDGPDQDQAARTTVMKLIERLKTGGDFGQLARQFSDSAASAAAGDLGWVRPGQLDPEIENTLARMKPGELAGPVRSAAGWHLLLLRERRAGAGVDPGKIQVKGVRLVQPLPKGASNAAAASEIELARQIVATASDCAGFIALAKRAGGPGSGEFGPVELNKTPPDIARTLATLAPGKAAAPIRRGDMIETLMLCERNEVGGFREEARNRLGMERLDQEARRLMRDLRLAAHVDARL